MNKVEIFKLESYVRPDIVEKYGTDWVLNGYNNEFFQYIIDRYNGSPTNSAVIDAYSQMIYGLGLNIQIPLLPKKEVRRIVKDFEMFGMASFEVMYLQNAPVKIVHVPTEKIAPEKANDEGNITGYFYSYDWNNQMKYPPKRMDAFGYGKGAKRSEIFVIKDYQVGQFYFSNPSYLSALPYAELEEEIANFCINYVKNKFSVGTIINVNNGIPESEEERGKISRQYKSTATGTDNAGAVVIAFNDNKENATTVEQIQIVDGYQQYEFVSKHAQDNICTAHKLVSKSMIGISTGSGFSSTADEIQMAFDESMMNVIQPKQEIILDAFQQIASMVGVQTNLEFLSLRPKVEAVQPSEQLSLSAQLLIDLGEDIDIDGYELESVKPVDYAEEDAIKLATSTGVAFPNRKSIYDTEYNLVRYRYAGNIAPEREFCVKMMKANKIYRREDIEAMGSVVVNPGFGMHPNPDNPYSIWLYKGGGLLSANHPGGTCKHYWEKLIFRKKDIKVDTKSPIAIDDAKKLPASGIAGQTPHSR
jgi:hypothetical protein